MVVEKPPIIATCHQTEPCGPGPRTIDATGVIGIRCWVAIGAVVRGGNPCLTRGVRARTGEPPDRVHVEEVRVMGAEIAIVVMDMWDNHWDPCWVAHAGARAEPINGFLHKARAAGAVVIHSPTNLIAGHDSPVYANTKQRLLSTGVPEHAMPPDNGFKAPTQVPWGTTRYEAGKSTRMDGTLTTAPCLVSNQCIGVDIEESDYITGDGGHSVQETWNILHTHGSKYLLYVGGATNMCLYLKPIGLRHMKARGVKTVLVRDLAIAWSDPYHWYLRNEKLPDSWGYTALKADRFVADWMERDVGPAVTSDVFPGPEVRTLKLTGATARHSQPGFEVGKAIDGTTTRKNGWANGDTPDGDNVAVFELAEDADNVCGKRLRFVMQFASHERQYSIGKFRFAVTADDRSTFADGKPSCGNVAAKWTVLRPDIARSLSVGTEMRIGDDGTVLAVTPKSPDFDCYYVDSDNPLEEEVTGLRLDVLRDESLPAGGPGMAPNGNFVLGEINVRTWRQ